MEYSEEWIYMQRKDKVASRAEEAAGEGKKRWDLYE
jgi:hypothetical protein